MAILHQIITLFRHIYLWWTDFGITIIQSLLGIKKIFINTPTYSAIGIIILTPQLII